MGRLLLGDGDWACVMPAEQRTRDPVFQTTKPLQVCLFLYCPIKHQLARCKRRCVSRPGVLSPGIRGEGLASGGGRKRKHGGQKTSYF